MFVTVLKRSVANLLPIVSVACDQIMNDSIQSNRQYLMKRGHRGLLFSYS